MTTKPQEKVAAVLRHSDDDNIDEVYVALVFRDNLGARILDLPYEGSDEAAIDSAEALLIRALEAVRGLRRP